MHYLLFTVSLVNIHSVISEEHTSTVYYLAPSLLFYSDHSNYNFQHTGIIQFS